MAPAFVLLPSLAATSRGIRPVYTLLNSALTCVFSVLPLKAIIAAEAGGGPAERL